ncbi:hypothetical protein QVD17_32257 [Tagetes erecta]|uniref:Uncharacterized protein n=1 Tax=Tagetes erecta TaxID=13708 RepID=A0AAD8K7N9_TARER|nr:hypothetical protein QVD17_32257 [Tagetes erecta]
MLVRLGTTSVEEDILVKYSQVQKGERPFYTSWDSGWCEKCRVGANGIDWNWEWIRTPSLGAEPHQFPVCFAWQHGFSPSYSTDSWVWHASDDLELSS